MTPEQIAWWWCCQADATRSSLVGALILYASDPMTTLRATLDALLLINGYINPSPLYELWVSTFQVSFEEVEVEGVPTEFVIFDVTFWTAMAAFAVDTGTACDEPCYILKFALEHATGA